MSRALAMLSKSRGSSRIILELMDEAYDAIDSASFGCHTDTAMMVWLVHGEIVSSQELIFLLAS